MPSFVKQADFLLTSKYLNDINDATVGGTITGVPSGVPATQGAQTRLGDRICLSDAEALALSDTGVNTLYGGIYQYVTLDASATTFKNGQLMFWKGTSGYTVTNVESANLPDIAGVYIGSTTTPAAGNQMWIQIAGRATVLFRTTLTGTAVVHSSVFASVAGAGADNATADILGVATTIASSTLAGWIGTTVTTATNATASLVDLRGLTMRF